MKIYLSLDRLLSDPRSRTVPRQTDLSPLKSTTSEEEEVELPTSSPDNHNSPPLTTGNIRLEAPESPSNLPSLAITVAVDGELPITVARRGPRSRGFQVARWLLLWLPRLGVGRTPPWNSGRPGRSHSARSVTLDRELLP